MRGGIIQDIMSRVGIVRSVGGLAWRALAVSLVLSGAATALAADRPALVARVEPVYPEAAAEARIEGVVTAAVDITAEGRVRSVSLLTETPPGHGFGLAATNALWRWRFAPGEAAQRTITLAFRHPQPYTLAEYQALPGTPKPIASAAPRYPSLARRDRIAGEVGFVLVIDEDGLLTRAQIVVEAPVDRHFAFMAASALDAFRFPRGRPGVYRHIVRFDPAHAKTDPPLDRTAKRLTLPNVCLTDAHAYYPEALRETDTKGKVRLAIQVAPTGYIETMECLTEQPAQSGFCDLARHTEEMTTFGAVPVSAFERTYLFQKERPGPCRE